MTHRVLITFVLAFATITPPTWAQSSQPPAKPAAPAEGDSSSPGLWNTEIMMEAAVQQLKRRYNLNADQEQYTRALLKKRVREYLKQHETELRALLSEALELQRDPTRADNKRMKEWSERALPLFTDARKAILDGNKEWGDILDETQKRVHKYDLDQMNANFTQMDEKFNRWSKGGFRAEDLYPQPPTRPSSASPGMMSKRPLRSEGPATSNPEDFWEVFVNQMIALYKFTPEQESSARAILKDCRDKAAQYRSTNKIKLDNLTERVNALRAVADKRDEFRKLQDELTALLKPIQIDLFQELRQRVEALATADQRAVVDASRKQQQERTKETTRQWEERRKKMQAAASQKAEPHAATQPVAATSAAKR